MCTIGVLFSSSDSEQPSLRSAVLRKQSGKAPAVTKERYADGGDYADYIKSRAKSPSDGITTELFTFEFTPVWGEMRWLASHEVQIFLSVIGSGSVESTGHPFSWGRSVLAGHLDRRRELVAGPTLILRVLEELQRYEPPGPPRHRGREYHRQIVLAGLGLLPMVLSADNDERQLPRMRAVRHQPARHVRPRLASPWASGCPSRWKHRAQGRSPVASRRARST